MRAGAGAPRAAPRRSRACSVTIMARDDSMSITYRAKNIELPARQRIVRDMLGQLSGDFRSDVPQSLVDRADRPQELFAQGVLQQVPLGPSLQRA